MSCGNETECKCDSCSGDLCPGDIFCGSCGAECDPDATRGFVRKRRLERGDTLEIEYDLIDKDGNPLDLGAVGVKVWFTIKYYLSDVDQNAVAQATLANGQISLRDVATSGRILVTVPATATQYVREGTTKLYYDLQVKDAGARISTVEKGLFLVDPDVTRALA